MAGTLAGLHVLIAEDNFLVASDLADLIGSADGTGDCVNSISDALSALSSGTFDGVLLDLKLKDGLSFDVARKLRDRGIPYIVVTGYDERMLPLDLRLSPRLTKPFSKSELIALVARTFGADR